MRPICRSNNTPLIDGYNKYDKCVLINRFALTSNSLNAQVSFNKGVILRKLLMTAHHIDDFFYANSSGKTIFCFISVYGVVSFYKVSFKLCIRKEIGAFNRKNTGTFDERGSIRYSGFTCSTSRTVETVPLNGSRSRDHNRDPFFRFGHCFVMSFYVLVLNMRPPLFTGRSIDR